MERPGIAMLKLSKLLSTLNKLKLINECKHCNYARVFYIPHFMTKQTKKRIGI